MGFPGGSLVKNTPVNAGDLGSIPGSGRSLGEGNGNPLKCSCLENPMDRGAWWATVTIRNSGLQVGASKLSLHGRRHRWFYRIDFQVFEINSTVYLSEILTVMNKFFCSPGPLSPILIVRGRVFLGIKQKERWEQPVPAHKQQTTIRIN